MSTTATKVFADRIGRIEVSATMAITAAALKLKSEGVNLADFGAGEPHFATPRHIKDAAIDAIEKNFTRYTNVAGIPEVRRAIVDRHACDFGSDYTPDECVFTTGGKLALFNAIQVLVDHGDEVFKIMREMNRESGVAFIMVTHDDRLAQEADRILMIEDGWVHSVDKAEHRLRLLGSLEQ